MSYDSYVEDDLNVHVRRRRSPEPMWYVSSAPRPSHPASYLAPDLDMRGVIERSRSHERSRSCERAFLQPTGPVVIKNRICNDMPSDDEFQLLRRSQLRRRSSKSRSRSRSHARVSSQSQHMDNEDWQRELDRRQLERILIDQARYREQQVADNVRKDNEKLRRAKEELDAIKRREAQAEEEKRIRHEMELQRLRDVKRAQEERALRDEEASAAVEKYIKEEALRREEEERCKKVAEEEYQKRLQEQLLASGLDEESINAILKKEKVPKVKKERATHTRMPRKYLSLETLRIFGVDFDLDSDDPAGFVIIKRSVPECEQERFWKHTKYIRESRLATDDRRHSRHKGEIELAVRKKERKRS